MILRRFRIQVGVRTIALSATLGLALLLVFGPGSYFAAVIVGLFAAIQVSSLIRYIEKTNRDLTRLLESIRYSDFTQSFRSDGRGERFLELTEAMRSVVDDFRQARSEKEEGYRYLETVMHHVGIGLMSFDRDGNVNLVNTAAKRLLRVPHLKNISALDRISPALSEKLRSIEYGSNDLIRVVVGDEVLQLSIYATGFKLREEIFKLVSFQDIGGELDEAEAVAWRKLTRVLTHEIMNSVAPISSLAATAETLLETGPGPDQEQLDDIRGAVGTIARRSEGLLHFVDEYRRLSKVPEPNYELVPVDELFGSMMDLFALEAETAGVTIQQSIRPPALKLTADRDLIEQVLINLIRNAIDASSEAPHPEIRLDAFIDARSRAVIQVIDHGHGIVEEAIDKVFVPFFTTKKEGSGIGLALSREIMRRHGGSISVSSTPGEQTIFRLRF